MTENFPVTVRKELTSRQHTQCISEMDLLGRCCHTEVGVADQTSCLTLLLSTDRILPSSASADPITPGAWQGSH